MTTKKQQTFKNPFDLIEEEEQEPMSMPTRNNYVPPASNVHAPLPFNPYELSKQEPQPVKKGAAVSMVESSPVADKKINQNTATSFVSPFGQDENEPSTPTNQNQSYESPPRPQREYELDENGDPPLLQDIGIEPQKIKERIKLILKLGQPSYQVIQDPDLSGPILIALALGCLLLLSGKIHFGDIYAMFIFGNLLFYFLINFISQNEIIPLYSIMSTVGYGLLPMLGFGFIGIFLSVKSGVGIVVALAVSAWSSIAAGNFMDVLIKDTKDRKGLVIYPLFLFYISFTLIIIF